MLRSKRRRAISHRCPAWNRRHGAQRFVGAATWLMIAPAFGIPIWIGRGTTAVLAAAVAVVAVLEYARLVKLGRLDTGLLLVLAVLYPLAAWLHPPLLRLAPVIVLVCALPAVF